MDADGAPDPLLAAGADPDGRDTRSDGAGRSLSLLLVEDDERIRLALGIALEDEGFEVRGVSTGGQALAALAADGVRIDLVLLDLILPGMDGIEVCRLIRETSIVPVIMVTARSASADVVAGLEAGADDYVTKPVVASVLAARIRALARRAVLEPDGAPRLQLGDLEIDVPRGIVRIGREQVHTTKTEFQLLRALVEARGHVVTREQLLERVWGYDYFGDTRLLDVHIRRLRRKIEPDPGSPSLVLTVRGIGYRVAA